MSCYRVLIIQAEKKVDYEVGNNHQILKPLKSGEFISKGQNLDHLIRLLGYVAIGIKMQFSSPSLFNLTDFIYKDESKLFGSVFTKKGRRRGII